MSQKNIGIIGFGNMGTAIAGRLNSTYKIYVFDKDKNKLRDLKNAEATQSARDLADKSEVIILAVKPQDLDPVLREIKGALKDKLVISIAAGISTRYLEKALGAIRIIRAMPNIGMKIGDSVTCFCKGSFATSDDLDFSQELFYSLGVAREVEEKMMNAVTAISGSGPGYAFDFIEGNSLDPKNIPEHARHDMMRRLEQAAIAVGFNQEEAAFLAANTVNVSIELLKKTGLPPGELKKQVASKGGTTEAGLAVLNKGGSWEEAAEAALKRAAELEKRG